MQLPNLPAWLKISSTHLFATAVAAAILLFGPDSVVSALSLLAFVESYRLWVGLTLLLTASILVARGAMSLGNWAARKVWARQNLRRWQSRLHRLTPGEARILGGYIAHNTRTQYFEATDGIVQGLAAEDILFCPAGLVDILEGVPYNIQPWAFEYLKTRPEVLTSALAAAAPIEHARKRS